MLESRVPGCGMRSAHTLLLTMSSVRVSTIAEILKAEYVIYDANIEMDIQASMHQLLIVESSG